MGKILKDWMAKNAHVGDVYPFYEAYDEEVESHIANGCHWLTDNVEITERPNWECVEIDTPYGSSISELVSNTGGTADLFYLEMTPGNCACGKYTDMRLWAQVDQKLLLWQLLEADDSLPVESPTNFDSAYYTKVSSIDKVLERLDRTRMVVEDRKKIANDRATKIEKVRDIPYRLKDYYNYLFRRWSWTGEIPLFEYYPNKMGIDSYLNEVDDWKELAGVDRRDIEPSWIRWESNEASKAAREEWLSGNSVEARLGRREFRYGVSNPELISIPYTATEDVRFPGYWNNGICDLDWYRKFAEESGILDEE